MNIVIVIFINISKHREKRLNMNIVIVIFINISKHREKRLNCSPWALSRILTKKRVFNKVAIFVCVKLRVNPIPLTTNLQPATLKTSKQKFRKSPFIKVWSLNRVESIVARGGEITHKKQFLLLGKCFQTSSEGNASKCVCKWGNKLSIIVTHMLKMANIRHYSYRNKHQMNQVEWIPSWPFFIYSGIILKELYALLSLL